MTPNSAPPTVLIADDDQDILETVGLVLRHKGYRVLTAPDGELALALLRTGERPSLIMLDLMMPSMNGWQFRTEQSKDPELARIPVVAFTGARPGERNDLAHIEQLQKPVSLDRLLETVERYCGPIEPARAAL
jgi:CheY-like chemotaxis protein